MGDYNTHRFSTNYKYITARKYQHAAYDVALYRGMASVIICRQIYARPSNIDFHERRIMDERMLAPDKCTLRRNHRNLYDSTGLFHAKSREASFYAIASIIEDHFISVAGYVIRAKPFMRMPSRRRQA